MQKKTIETKKQLEEYLKEVKIIDSKTLQNYNVQVWKLSRTTLDKILTILQEERKIIIKPSIYNMHKFNIFYCAKTQNVT